MNPSHNLNRLSSVKPDERSERLWTFAPESNDDRAGLMRSSLQSGLDEPTALPIGRERETEVLTGHLAAAAAGAKRGAVLVGAPGIGKTTVLRWCAARADESGFAVAFVRVPGGAGLPPRYPIGPVVDGLAASCRARGTEPPESLVRLENALRDLSPAAAFPVALPQVAEAIEEVAGLLPVAILLDDWHWAPAEGSALLLSALRAAEGPLLLVAAARPASPDEPASSPLPEPSGDLWVGQIAMSGLPRDAVAQLAARELGGPPLPSLVDALHDRAVGNPLFVVELLRGWMREQMLEEMGGFFGIARDPGSSWSAPLHEIVGRRIDALEPDAVSAAAALAVLGRDASAEELIAVTGLEPAPLVDALSALEAGGFANRTGTPGRYQLAHPVFVSGLLASLGPTKRAALHGRIFDGLAALADANGRPTVTELAHHAVRALVPPPQLRELLEAAAEESDTVGSYEEAAQWYGHLAEATAGTDDAATVQALVKRARAITHFDPRKAVEDINAALDLESDPTQRARLVHTRAQALRVLGEVDAAMQDLAEATPHLEGDEAVEAQLLTAALHGIRSELDEAEKILAHLGSAQRFTEAHRAMLQFMKGDLTGAIHRLTKAIKAPATEERLHLAHNLSWLLMLSGDWPAARRLLEHAIELARSRGDAWNHAGLLNNSARLYAWTGSSREAFEECSRGRRLASRIGSPACEIDSLDALGLVLLEAGQPDKAVRALQRAVALANQGEETRELAFTYARLAEAHLRLGQHELARLALQEGRHNEYPKCWQWSLLRVEAEVELADGEAALALQLSNRAAASLRDMPFEEGQALICAGRSLLKMKRKKDAQATFEQAAARFRTLSAKVHLVTAEAALEADLRRPGRPKSRGPFTPRQAEILELVAQGLTNRDISRKLFLSERTIAKHLENMSARVGARGRAQLVARYLQQEGSSG